ncbi:general substrate transporter [Dothidotthia symphoricarpi CBS 119687]|uniref:General substrate transporter n=1 Tax=Dothidotthia symphoricarpi CBS 119687 TaxID=1392245 RepID=A0A6A6AS10_9PLEO|nr:general substrate transporter [Dothidotthia symphoricarpi CBS 119687]KAF2134003.1 general substrate transporter [Dothidotthia symphoricarpi CBS 119687]
MSLRRSSAAAQNAAIKARSSAVAEQIAGQESWFEKKLKPRKVNARYPIKGSMLLYATCGFGSLGDALFGYNSGIMSGLLVNPVFIRRFYSDYGGADGTTASINPSITGISVSCLQLTAALGALLAGWLGDIIGRKKCVRIGGFIYFFSAFIQMFAPGFATFVAGRTIQGLGVGFLSMTVPIIQTEIAAPHARGLMVGIEYTFLIAGYMLSCWVDYGFHFMLPAEMSWQGPFIIQIILSFILVVMSFFLPETPRWLAKNGFMQESLQTVADLHSNGDTEAVHVQQVFLEIQEAVVYETNLGKSTWTEMFTRYRKRTIVGITVQMFAQLNGINIISFYLPSTLSAAGFDDRKSLLYTAANALPYTAATVATWWLADRWGRKPLMILGGVLMAILLGVVCAFTEADMAVHTKANGQYAFVMLYNIVYGFTWGPVPWLVPAECFPLRGRSKGMALSTTSNWIFNFIIGMVSPDAFAGIGGYFYLVIAGFCLFSAGLAHFYYVETAGHTLEEISVAFGDKAFADSDEEIMETATIGDEKARTNV